MSQRKVLTAGSLALLISISSPISANKEESQQEKIADDLTEAFIGLRIGNGGSSFYRILVDADEDPYIDIDSFLTHLIGVTPECDFDRFFCTVLLPQEKKHHWIDGYSLRMSDGNTGKELELKPNDIIKKDGSIWIHYEALEDWMPLKAIWSLRAYELSINPLFTLPKDRISEREKQRRRQEEEKENRLKAKESSVIEVPDLGNQFYEARGQIITSASSESELYNELSLEVGADILRGRLQAGSNFSENEANLLEYWQYERFNNTFGDYLGIGQVFYGGNLVESSRVLEDGFRITRKYQSEGVGEFTLNATVPEESVVDVYKNGFYEDTVIADELGQVVISNVQATSGDVISLKSISKEGIESDQSFTISGEFEQFLDKGDWDYELVGGSEINGDISVLSFDYGLRNNLTTGLSVKRVATNTNDKISALASIAYRPHHRISIQWQQEFGENNWAYSTDFQLWHGHDVRVFGQNTSERSLAFGSKTKESFHGIEHEWGSPRWQAQTRITDSDQSKIFRERLGVKLNSRWDFRLEGEKTFRKETGLETDRWTANSIYILPNGSKFEAGFSGGDFGDRWFAGLRWLGETEAPWSQKTGNNRFSLNLNVDHADGALEPRFDLKWHHGDSISGSFAVSKDLLKAQARWKFGFAKKSGSRNEEWHRQNYEYFRRGSVEGRLMTPETADMKSGPLPNTTLWFSNVQVTTDEDGYFVAQGLPTNLVMEARIEMESLPIDLMADKKQWKVRVRPGTVLEFDPKLIWSVGIDGYLDIGKYQPGIKLIFEHESLGVLSEVEVEGDGFFIAERLAPGNYTVEILFPTKEPQFAKINIEENRSWISDFKIDPKK